MEKKLVNAYHICIGLLVSFFLGYILSNGYAMATGHVVDNIPLPPPSPTWQVSCSDNVKNPDETDKDCGGVCSAQGKKCALDKSCFVNGDCESDYCYIQWCRQKPKPIITPFLEKKPELKQEVPEQVIVTATAPPPPRAGKAHMVFIQKLNGKLVFVPAKLEIFLGDTVIITNNDTATHHPLSYDRSHEGKKLALNESWSFTPYTVGEAAILDDLNPATEGLWKDFQLAVTAREWTGACDDEQKDLDESDIDCGGSCFPCELGRQCNVETDCQSKSCLNALCSSPLPVSCADNIKNQDESAIDCGGSCRKCTDAMRCVSANDCLSGYCAQNGICITASCTDNEKGFDESDIDCGGKCYPCLQGKSCRDNADCVTETCVHGICDIPTVNIQLAAKQFAFLPDTIIVEKGTRVRLNLTSLDVHHGFSLPAFNILAEVKPQEFQFTEFIADKAGAFEFVCSVYCGTGHGAMRGKLIVEEKKEEKGKVVSGPQQMFPLEAMSGKKQKGLWLFFLLFLLAGAALGYTLLRRERPQLKEEHKEPVGDYIRVMKKKGYSDQQIHRQLVHHGYAKEEIEKYLSPAEEKLEHYVRRMKRLGYTQEKIMKELVSQGYDAVVIHDALERAKWR